MEELAGVPLSQFLEGSPSFRRGITTRPTETLLIEALNAWVATVAACDTFHADVHAGNLFVMRDGRLAFIDFGSVGAISAQTRRGMEDLARSLPRSDWTGAARALVRMGAIIGGDDAATYAKLGPLASDLERLADRVDALVLDVVAMEGGNVTTAAVGSLGALNGAGPGGGGGGGGAPPIGSLEIAERANRLVLDVVEVAENRGLRFPREFALLIKQMLYFDRFVQELAPELDVLTDDRISKQLTA